MAPLCKLVRINNNFISLIIKALIIQVAPLCKLAGVSTRLVVTERAGHAQHMLQVSAYHGDDCGGDCCGDRGGGGVDIS